jgi:hypothetical protein
MRWLTEYAVGVVIVISHLVLVSINAGGSVRVREFVDAGRLTQRRL